MAGHSDGKQEGLFCAVRTDKCALHGNKYQNNGAPDTPWVTFLQGSSERVEKRHEAHHILCIASVTEHIVGYSNIKPIVENTSWCINAKPNMMPMPLWGHTIQHYCDVGATGAAKNALAALTAEDEPPPFQNIPMHDYDHNSSKGYKKADVDAACIKLAQRLEESKKSHEDKTKELASELDELSKKLGKLLSMRGAARCGGTHAAWKKGIKQPNSDWYLPFSMASSGAADKRSFPSTDADDDRLANKIKRLAEALARWSGT
jgi:hypothetical protein